MSQQREEKVAARTLKDSTKTAADLGLDDTWRIKGSVRLVGWEVIEFEQVVLSVASDLWGRGGKGRGRGRGGGGGGEGRHFMHLNEQNGNQLMLIHNGCADGGTVHTAHTQSLTAVPLAESTTPKA